MLHASGLLPFNKMPNCNCTKYHCQLYLIQYFVNFHWWFLPMPKNNIIADTAINIETRIFPVLFFYFSLKHLYTLYINAGNITHKLIGSTMPTVNYFIFLSDVLIVIVLIPFNLLIAYALVISRNLHQKPEGFLEFFVPLLATFWFLTYNLIPDLPAQNNFLVIPQSSLPLSISIGSICVLVGLITASVGIYNLRKSFGIFVQVRDIVTKGLYRYVRHPIYFGHIMAHIGFFLITPRFYALTLSTALLLITLFRAKLEEKKLFKYSQYYREYMKTTPFIIPYKIK